MITKQQVTPIDPNDLLRPGEVATLFRVESRTVAVWADTGLLKCARTAYGHRRYYKHTIYELLGYDPQSDSLLLPEEVADILRVKKITVIRWAERGEIESIKTPGGQYRIKESALRSILEQ